MKARKFWFFPLLAEMEQFHLIGPFLAQIESLDG